MYKFLFLIFSITQILFAVDAEVDIVRKTNIVPNINIVVTGNSIDNALADKVKKVLENDLTVSGHFNSENTIINHQSIDTKFDFKNNINMKSHLVLLLEVKEIHRGLTIDVVLEDASNIVPRHKKTYTISDIARYPFLAHKITIDINKELNSPPIDWMDKFIIFSKYTSAKRSEIVIADYTLIYQKVIVSGGLNIFPKWASSDQKSFYYTAYDGLYPTLMKQDLYSKRVEKIIHSNGMVVCSDVSKDGSKLLLTMAPNGQSDIYEYDLEKRTTQKITKYTGIDVGACYLGVEDKIVFVSDRFGNANIFSQKIGTDSVERLVYHGKNNTQATTYKNYVAYSSREEHGNGFNLYLISVDNDGIKKLTSQGANQFPKFSFDGESILYINNSHGNSSLGIFRLNYGKHFLFPLKGGKIQSIDW